MLLLSTTIAAEMLDFVIIYPVLHPFFSSTSQGARAEAARRSDVNLSITGPSTQSPKDQITLMERYIAQGVDAIAIGPADDSLRATIDSAIEANIPVICIDTDAPDSKRAAYIGTDNYEAGFEMGRQVARHVTGATRIIISVSNLRTRNMTERVAGFTDAVADHDNITIVAIVEGMATSETIYKKIEDHIEQQDFNAIVTMDAESGPMVVRMWKAWGLDHPVFCFDDRRLVIEGLNDGIVRVAIIQNQYAWGTEAVKTMIALSRGETVPDFIDTGIRVVTPESIPDHLR